MALLVLTLMGSVIGWIATIIARIEDRGGILKHIVIGMIAAVVIGIIANDGGFLGGLSVMSCFAAFLGSSMLVAAIVLFNQRMRSQ